MFFISLFLLLFYSRSNTSKCLEQTMPTQTLPPLSNPRIPCRHPLPNLRLWRDAFTCVIDGVATAVGERRVASPCAECVCRASGASAAPSSPTASAPRQVGGKTWVVLLYFHRIAMLCISTFLWHGSLIYFFRIFYDLKQPFQIPFSHIHVWWKNFCFKLRKAEVVGNKQRKGFHVFHQTLEPYNFF